MSQRRPATTIDDVLSASWPSRSGAWPPTTMRNYTDVIELLRHCLNGYSHQYLDDAERWRFGAAYDCGDEEAFVHLFAPEKIVDGLGEFLGCFTIRKVAAGQELLRAAGTVSKKAGTLGQKGLPRPRRRRARRGASALAEPGWSVNVVLARAEDRWHIVEVGNVYP